MAYHQFSTNERFSLSSIQRKTYSSIERRFGVHSNQRMSISCKGKLCGVRYRSRNYSRFTLNLTVKQQSCYFTCWDLHIWIHRRLKTVLFLTLCLMPDKQHHKYLNGEIDIKKICEWDKLQMPPPRLTQDPS